MIDRDMFYNPDLKEKFLNQYSKDTARNYYYALRKSRELEEEKGKDLCNFNYEDLDELFYSFRVKSMTAIQSNASIIRKYLDFCIEQGYNETMINIAEVFDSFLGKNIEKYINKVADKKKILSYDEVWELCDMCVNAQDAVVFALLFEGVKGENLKELSNLRVDDVDFENKTLTVDRDGENVLKISDRTMELIKEAINQEIYSKGNGGEFLSETVRSFEYPLYDSKYVIRVAGRDRDEEVQANTIISRIMKVRKWYGNEFVTATNMWLSGMIYELQKIKDTENRDLDIDDYRKVLRRFGKGEKYAYETRGKIDKYIS